MASRRRMTVDGNEAAASVAYRASETIAIYPITPSSPMAEVCDEWASRKRPNLWNADSGDGGDAVGGGRGRRRPRRAAGRRALDDVHGVAGAAADDPQHVQDRGRADAVRDARGGAHARDPRPVDFRRPLRRHGLPSDRLRPALLELRPGSARHGRRGPRGDARDQAPLSAFLRRVPHVARGREDRRAQRRRSPLAHLGIAGLRAPPARADAGPAGAARHGAESRRLLSGARSAERVLRRVSRRRRADDGVVRAR